MTVLELFRLLFSILPRLTETERREAVGVFASAVKRSYGWTRTWSLTDVLVLKYIFLCFSVQSTSRSATVHLLVDQHIVIFNQFPWHFLVINVEN